MQVVDIEGDHILKRFYEVVVAIEKDPVTINSVSGALTREMTHLCTMDSVEDKKIVTILLKLVNVSKNTTPDSMDVFSKSNLWCSYHILYLLIRDSSYRNMSYRHTYMLCGYSTLELASMKINKFIDLAIRLVNEIIVWNHRTGLLQEMKINKEQAERLISYLSKCLNQFSNSKYAFTLVCKLVDAIAILGQRNKDLHVYDPFLEDVTQNIMKVIPKNTLKSLLVMYEPAFDLYALESIASDIFPNSKCKERENQLHILFETIWCVYEWRPMLANRFIYLLAKIYLNTNNDIHFRVLKDFARSKRNKTVDSIIRWFFPSVSIIDAE